MIVNQYCRNVPNGIVCELGVFAGTLSGKDCNGKSKKTGFFFKKNSNGSRM
jgi:hypothetical protein